GPVGCAAGGGEEALLVSGFIHVQEACPVRREGLVDEGIGTKVARGNFGDLRGDVLVGGVGGFVEPRMIAGSVEEREVVVKFGVVAGARGDVAIGLEAGVG